VIWRIGCEFDILVPKCWYHSLTSKRIIHFCGESFFRNYDKSPPNILLHLIPELEWQLWRFPKAPASFWNDPNSHHAFFRFLSLEYHVGGFKDWYNVTLKEIEDCGGATLLRKHFNGSPSQFIMKMDPEHEWEPWRFHVLPKGFWKKEDNQMAFFRRFETQMCLKSEEDWYKIKTEDMVRMGGRGFLSQFRYSLFDILSHFKTKYKWLAWKFYHVPGNFWTIFSQIGRAHV